MHLRKSILTFGLTIGALLMAPAHADAQGALAPRKGYIPASDGVNYYYEIHGQGEPLLLLHGGLGSIDMFGPILPAFAKQRQVIAVDLQGHGRTTLGERPIDLVSIGNDLAMLLRKLDYDTVDVVGYSFGGGAGFRLAVQYPGLVRRLVIVSAPFAQEGFYPEMLPQQAAVGAAMVEQMKPTPMYQSYIKLAPRPADFPRLLDRMGEFMRKPYDWTEDVKKLKGPVMLVYGDADMVRPEHIVRSFQLLGGGLKDAGWQREHMSKNRLAILPNLTHYEMFMAPTLVTTVLPFLNGEQGAPVWTTTRDK
ncbi:MAG: alpha/beta hydrolase [Ignavibacteriales bacterium]|nr:alpha/beta hydrolase [Ignavibacteriales bacterium]